MRFFLFSHCLLNLTHEKGMPPRLGSLTLSREEKSLILPTVPS